MKLIRLTTTLAGLWLFSQLPCAAQSPLLFTDVESFSGRSFVHLDFESGQGSATDVNSYLLAKPFGASFSQGTALVPGGSALISTQSFNDAVAAAISPSFGGGVDGGAVSGSGHLQGSGADLLVLDFATPVDAAGFFLGGSLASGQGDIDGLRILYTLSDGSQGMVSKSSISSLLPTVANNAPSAQAINGFIGLDSNGGKGFTRVVFRADSDTQSIDDVYFGFARPTGVQGPKAFSENLTGTGSTVPLPAASRVTATTAAILATTPTNGNFTRVEVTPNGQAPVSAQNQTQLSFGTEEHTSSVNVGGGSAQATARRSFGSNHVAAQSSIADDSVNAQAEARSTWTDSFGVNPVLAIFLGDNRTAEIRMRIDGLFSGGTEAGSTAELVYSLVYTPLGDNLDLSDPAQRVQTVIDFHTTSLDSASAFDEIIQGSLIFSYGRAFELTSTLYVRTENNGGASFLSSASIVSFGVPEDSLVEIGSVLMGESEASQFAVTTIVPEPGSFALAAFGCAVLLGTRRKGKL